MDHEKVNTGVLTTCLLWDTLRRIEEMIGEHSAAGMPEPVSGAAQDAAPHVGVVVGQGRYGLSSGTQPGLSGDQVKLLRK